MRPPPEDPLRRRLDDIEFVYADRDPKARKALEDRIAAAGRRSGVISYDALVEGVSFRIANVHEGKAFLIRPGAWTELDRAVVGSFLGAISADSFRTAGFLASALVVGEQSHRPGEHFVRWMRDLEVLADISDGAIATFWREQVHKAHDWYGGMV